MANILQQIALPQETIEVDGVSYLVTAMSATDGLKFMEREQESIDSGKTDLSVIKQVIIKHVAKDNVNITDKSFDIIFSRKLKHLQNLYKEVLKYNFEDVFTAPDTEEQE